MIETIDVQEIAYHRNGVSGEGFYAIHFTAELDPGDGPKDGESRRFFGVVFPPEQRHTEGNWEGEPVWVGGDPHNPRVAVFDADKLAAGDIAFGSNSWRGDAYAPQLYEAIEKYSRRAFV